MKKRTMKRFQINRETVRALDRAHLEVIAGGLPTTPIGTCTDAEPCMSTAPTREQFGKGY